MTKILATFWLSCCFVSGVFAQTVVSTWKLVIGDQDYILKSFEIPVDSGHREGCYFLAPRWFECRMTLGGGSSSELDTKGNVVSTKYHQRRTAWELYYGSERVVFAAGVLAYVRLDESGMPYLSVFPVPPAITKENAKDEIVHLVSQYEDERNNPKTAQPDATDNPDDAQRLREDH